VGSVSFPSFFFPDGSTLFYWPFTDRNLDFDISGQLELDPGLWALAVYLLLPIAGIGLSSRLSWLKSRYYQPLFFLLLWALAYPMFSHSAGVQRTHGVIGGALSISS
jgi:hypothetical protein